MSWIFSTLPWLHKSLLWVLKLADKAKIERVARAEQILSLLNENDYFALTHIKLKNLKGPLNIEDIKLLNNSLTELYKARDLALLHTNDYIAESIKQIILLSTDTLSATITQQDQHTNLELLNKARTNLIKALKHWIENG